MIGFVFSVLFVLLFFCVAINSEPDDETRYVCILDAGSTGTRVYIYSYSFLAPLASIQVVKHKRLRPALSSFVNDPENLTLHLNSLLSFAAQWVPAAEHARTPVSLMATAGVRRLPIEQQDSLLISVRSILDVSPFRHPTSDNSPGNTGILTGPEEAAYNFLAVLAAFRSAWNVGQSMSSENILLGSADLGGSSTQFAFMCPRVVSVAGQNQCGDIAIDPKLGNGAEMGVHARSAAGLGLIEGMEYLMLRYERERLHECATGGSHVPKETCADILQKSHIWGLTLSDDDKLSTWVKEMSNQNNPCLPIDGVPIETADGEHIILGSGNFDACVRLIHDYIVPRARQALLHCPSENVGQRATVGSSGEADSEEQETVHESQNGTWPCSKQSLRRPNFIIGIDNFPKVLEVLGLKPEAGFCVGSGEGEKAFTRLALAPVQIAVAGQHACRQTWKDLLLSMPPDTHPYRAHRACYGSAFIYVLLTEVYGMPSSASEFVPLESVDPFGELGWALGAAHALAVEMI